MGMIQDLKMFSGLNETSQLVLLLFLLFWVLPWKGVALWKASRNNQKKWFIVLLVLNTFAILEIVYIFYFSQPRTEKDQI